MSRWLKTLLKAILSLGFLVILLGKIDITKSVDLLMRAGGFAIVAVLLTLVFQIGLAVFRWQVIMIRRNMSVLPSHSVRYFWVGLFFNQLLPSSIGGDAVRGYCLVRDGQSLGQAALSVLLDRILGTFGLVVLVAIFVPYAIGVIGDQEIRWGISIALVLVSMGLAGLFFADMVAQNFSKWSLMRGLTILAKAGRELLVLPWGRKLVLLSVVIHCISILSVGLCAWALHIRVDWMALAVIVPVAMLLLTIPISIAGWGVREGIMVVGLGYAGVASEQALALSILYGLSLLVVSLPGGVLWLADPVIRTIRANQVLAEESK